jgi:SAM-dependent methyltransferase
VYSEYDKFARIYNKHWGDAFTNEAISAFEKFVFTRLPAKATILDLCCGTGQLAKILSSRGYEVTGIDGSREMLRFARKNAPNCKFILDDARNFNQGQSFDAAVSAFDSLNHITKLDELKLAFQHTYDALKGGGIFLFDLNMDEHFKQYWRGSFGIVEDDHACVVRSSYDMKHKVARMDVTIFSLRRLSWTRSDLSLFERSYTAEAVVSALRQAGFVKVRFHNSQEALKLEDIGRMFFVGERSKSK